MEEATFCVPIAILVVIMTIRHKRRDRGLAVRSPPLPWSLPRAARERTLGAASELPPSPPPLAAAGRTPRASAAAGSFPPPARAGAVRAVCSGRSSAWRPRWHGRPHSGRREWAGGVARLGVRGAARAREASGGVDVVPCGGSWSGVTAGGRIWVPRCVRPARVRAGGA
ncbi:hypothetical protein VPH35_098750 [Triticum aestivum]